MIDEYSKYCSVLKSIQRELWVYVNQHQGARPAKIFVNQHMKNCLYMECPRVLGVRIKDCNQLFGIPIQEYYDRNEETPEYYFAKEKGNLWAFDEHKAIEIPVMIEDKEPHY